MFQKRWVFPCHLERITLEESVSRSECDVRCVSLDLLDLPFFCMNCKVITEIYRPVFRCHYKFVLFVSSSLSSRHPMLFTVLKGYSHGKGEPG